MRWISAAGGWLCLLAAQGGTLEQDYALAQAHDPGYRAARAELAAAEQAVPIARAALRPNVALSVTDAQVRGARTADNFLGQPVTTDLDYRSPQQSLQLRWPLLHREASRQLALAEARVQHAQALFALRAHDLLDRLAQAYLQRRFADVGVTTARAQLDTALEQQRLARRNLDLGEGTRPEALLADAEVAMARVQLTEAENQWHIAALALAQITGQPDGALAPQDEKAAPATPAASPAPSGHLPPAASWAPGPAGLGAWTATAMDNNPALAVRRLAVTASGLAVARAEAGHWPRLDLVASAANGRNDSVSTLNQAIRQRSIGLQLNVPLYAGGQVGAAVAQAVAERDKAQAELEAEELTVRTDVQRLFLQADSGRARLEALQQTLEAAAVALEGARRAQASGIGVQAEVARAQMRVAEARRELAKGRFEHLLARIRLHARAGMPPQESARLIDSLLTTPAAPTP